MSTRPLSPRTRASAATRAGVATRRASSDRMRRNVERSWRNKEIRPRASPTVARASTRMATKPAVSASPPAPTATTLGRRAARTATSTALEPSARRTRSPKARSAVRTPVPSRDAPERRAMRRVDRAELFGELREGDVAELVDEASDEAARQPRAVLLPREGRPVHVGLAIALAREQPLLVEAGH